MKDEEVVDVMEVDMESDKHSLGKTIEHIKQVSYVYFSRYKANSLSTLEHGRWQSRSGDGLRPN